MKKGEIVAIEGNVARVKECTGAVTMKLQIPEHLPKKNIKKGTKVAFETFVDSTGVILAVLEA